MGGVDPPRGARGFLAPARVRGAVRAEEEARVPAGRRLHEGEAVLLALGHRQTEVVGPQPPREHGVAREQEVMRGEGRREPLGTVLHPRDALARAHVLEDDLEPGEALDQREEAALEEHPLAVEDVHLRVGDLAVDEQRETRLGHGGQRPVGPGQVGHAGVGVRGRPRGVELHSGDRPARPRPQDLRGRGLVREVEGHQRLEREPRGHGREHALAIGQRLRRGGDRRQQIRHDDRPAEAPRRVRRDRGERRPVAQVQVPVVRPGETQGRGCFGHGGFLGVSTVATSDVTGDVTGVETR